MYRGVDLSFRPSASHFHHRDQPRRTAQPAGSAHARIAGPGSSLGALFQLQHGQLAAFRPHGSSGWLGWTNHRFYCDRRSRRVRLDGHPACLPTLPLVAAHSCCQRGVTGNRPRFRKAARAFVSHNQNVTLAAQFLVCCRPQNTQLPLFGLANRPSSARILER